MSQISPLLLSQYQEPLRLVESCVHDLPCELVGEISLMGKKKNILIAICKCYEKNRREKFQEKIE